MMFTQCMFRLLSWCFKLLFKRISCNSEDECKNPCLGHDAKLQVIMGCKSGTLQSLRNNSLAFIIIAYILG